MQNSDESLERLPGLIRKLVAEYLGDIDDPPYEQRLNELAVLIDPHYDDTWVNLSASTNAHSDRNLETIKSFLDEPRLKDQSIIALKACHAEATREAAQYPTKRQNAIASIPTDVWTSKILPNLDNSSVLALILSCKFFNNRSQQTVLRRKNRKLLVELVLANNTSEVQPLLAACATNDTIKNLIPDLLRPYHDCIREHSPFYVAAMDRNKPMFDLLVNRLPQQNHALYELVYLVISNQGKMQGKEWKFEVETFLKNNDPFLIFEPGPDGLSPLQIAAADKDIHMLLALLKQEFRANLEVNNELTLKEKWERCVPALLKDLPHEVQSTTLRQLQAVQANGWLIDAAPYTKAYSIFNKYMSDENWYAIGKLQRTMPLHARADIYSHGSNRREGAIPSYYERCGSRAIRFRDSDLFSYLSGLGTSFSLLRGAVAAGGCRLVGGLWAWGVGRKLARRVAKDSSALTRHFEVRTQQLDIIVNALELLQQKVNNINPVIQQSPSML